MATYWLYQIGKTIALNLPLNFAYKFAAFVSDIHCLFNKEDRKAVTCNLKIIFPQKTNKEIAGIRKAIFRNFAKYLVDFFRYDKLDKKFIDKNVFFQNKQYFDQARASGKGVIIVTAHLGNWELGGAVMGVLGHALSAVALVHQDKKVNDFFNRQRQSKGLTVIPFGKAVRQCLRVLEEKGILALVGDRDFGERGQLIDFFGKKTLFPEGPAAFGLKTGALIVPIFMVRNNDDTFTLHFNRPIECKNSGDKKNDLIRTIFEYKEIFERYIKQYPEQWYMFRKFYKQ
ncbi:MAG: lysophospholipid acyltransferase family protein [Candidatus Omnitrophica bacterium]|jgi:KDO2-lipid IV(A) lauroyltransferase|nr:lysophospholipid acyltransferase family protein [Candidatus Omnitrophota bacterium]